MGPLALSNAGHSGMKMGVEASQGKAGFSRSRLFRWGIIFWIVAWVISVCWWHSFDLNLKGCRGLRLDIGAGSVGCELSGNTVVFTHFGMPLQEFIFTKEIMDQIQQGPGIVGILAVAEWYHSSTGTTVAFPFAGFLWLWLAKGWVAEIRFRRLTKKSENGSPDRASISSRRLISLSVALVVLGGVTSYSSTKSRTAREASLCKMQIRNIQQSVRSWSGMNGLGTRQAIDWSKLIGKGNFIDPDAMHCPAGGSYELSNLTPDVGQLAAKCPHPEHQNFAHDDW